MKKEALILFSLLIGILLIGGCAKVPEEKPETKLDDLQVVACEEADKSGTCQTRLIEVGIVMPEECCEVLGKCCG